MSEDNIEALEFRIKGMKQRQTILAVFNVVCIITGLTVLFSFMEGIAAWIVFLNILWLFFGVILLGMDYKANDTGRFRGILTKIGARYADPPLDEWHESLEERNAFAVDEHTTTVTDGGEQE